MKADGSPEMARLRSVRDCGVLRAPAHDAALNALFDLGLVDYSHVRARPGVLDFRLTAEGQGVAAHQFRLAA